METTSLSRLTRTPHSLSTSRIRTLNGQSGGERYQPLAEAQGRSGLWYDDDEPGWGINLTEGATAITGVVTFYVGPQPRWVLGTALKRDDVTIPMRWYYDPGLCPSCGGSSPTTHTAAGSTDVLIPNGGSLEGEASTDISMSVGTWIWPLTLITRLNGP